jgi:hypothetical protein
MQKRRTTCRAEASAKAGPSTCHEFDNPVLSCESCPAVLRLFAISAIFAVKHVSLAYFTKSKV